jgi:hypothetical protein
MRKTITVVTAAVLLCLTSVASAAPGGGGGPGHGGGGGGGGGSSKGITLSVAPSLSVVEDETNGFQVAITRGGSSVGKCATTVMVSSADGTATAPSDYGSFSLPVTFAKGQTTQAVAVALVNDTVPEPTEAFTVNLGSVTSSCKSGPNTVTNATHTVTVSDHDVVFNVPAGGQVVVSNLSLGGCDALSARLRTPDGDIAIGSNSGGICGNVTGLGTTWTNNTGSDAVVTVLLVDGQCASETFSSDTTSFDYNATLTPYNHARTTPTGPGTWDLDITDSGGDCAMGFRVPAQGEGNLKANIAVESPPPNPAFSVGPGKRATIVVTLESCNALELLLIRGDTAAPLMTNEGFLCDPVSSDPAGWTVDNPYGAAEPVAFTLRLVDTSCTTALYDSDGTGEANHAALTGTDPIGVDITDGGVAPNCDNRTTDNVPAAGGGNLRATVTVSNLPLPPFTGTVVLQPGQTATIDLTLGGCNTLEAFLRDGVGGDRSLLGNLECDAIQTIAVVENTGSSEYQFTLALLDKSCDGEWDSAGGLDADHAAITTVHPYQVDIADGGADCGRVFDAVEPATGDGNLTATITIN